ncbi:MAG: PEGA domain-containing protein [Prevotellaceae bacterium]|nr:PEGA domain-containing protein [Prevotellaceae bacterium]
MLILIPVSVMAQEKLDVSVVSFAEDQFSTTAQDKRYEKLDGNGDRYAIIKVKDVDEEADLSGFTFNFGALNSEVKKHDDELWVYVQRNAKTVTIKHSEYKTIEKYDLNTTILPGRTYVMQLTLSRVEKKIVRDVKKQVLQFKVSPANEKAVVKVRKVGDKGEYELWGEVDEAGTIDKMREFGSYDYIVTALNYEQSTGRVTLTNSQTNHVEQVTLKPNFGFLEIDGSNGATGAQIYVDDVKIGTVPYHEPNTRWTCGNHRITINNGDMYKPYNSSFIIKQGETTRISPKLESDFAQTTIKVDGNAEIILDGISKGTGSWTGPLKAGQYTVVCRKENHRESSRMITVRPDIAETFTVPSPTPITGNIYVRSTPSGADITIDGKKKGTTPSLLQGIMIGSHNITLSLANHKTEDYSVTIKEDETEDINAKLSDMAHMTIDSKPSGATILINGDNVGTTPHSVDMASGDYEIALKKHGYYNFRKQVHLDSSMPNIMLNMSRQYFKSSMFYFGGGYQAGTMTCAGGIVGAYIHKVNVELSYMVGLSESEEIFWNHNDASDEPSSYTYKPTYMGAKLGYGINLNNRLRITPKVGCGVTQLKGTIKQDNGSKYKPEEAYAIPLSIGCSLDFALTPWCAIFARPEISFAVSESDIYNNISQVSTKVKGYASGFNALAGLYFYF